MSELHNETRKGFYLDSVALMRLSAEITAVDGVHEAVLMIGTPANKQIMRNADLLNSTGESASPDDLVIALRADKKASVNRALALVESALAGKRSSNSAHTRLARTVRSAKNKLPDANLTIVSTPGAYAAAEARKALELGMNVMIFSDNVSRAQEVSLKQYADEQDLLVMGPDCGTAYINGVPLAFANQVAQGNTGAIAASGTGLQEFSVLLTRLGGGLRHGIGVGGRDLSDAIGAISTLRAIRLLADDPQVKQIVLISKPPGPATAQRVFDALKDCGKPAIACVFGIEEKSTDSIKYTTTLRQTAEMATDRSLPAEDHHQQIEAKVAGLASTQKQLIGLFSGGTLGTEALFVLENKGLTLTTNTNATANTTDTPHQIIDLGADEYTVGKPHPMIEPAVRTPVFIDALNDPSIAVILLDLVLGYGAHPNPAAPIVAAITQNENQHPPLIIASVCGTDDDPQNYSAQANALRNAGVIVCNCNSAAAELAANAMQSLKP